MRQGLRNDWLNNGCHPLSVMLAIGGAVEFVVSVQNRVSHGADIIKFKNGAVGTFHLASGPQPIEEYHFYSSKWHLHIDDSSKVTLQRGILFIYDRTTSFTAQLMGSDSLHIYNNICLINLSNTFHLVDFSTF